MGETILIKVEDSVMFAPATQTYHITDESGRTCLETFATLGEAQKARDLRNTLAKEKRDYDNWWRGRIAEIRNGY